MKKIIVLAIVAVLAWQGYERYNLRAERPSQRAQPAWSPTVQTGVTTSAFRCDGRTHCSQMTSCAEATYFLKTCPGVKMDGNNDGIPCEQQWCK